MVGTASITLAMLVSGIPGIILLILIYKLDSIEPEPVPLLVKLFLCGGFLVPIFAVAAGLTIGALNSLVFGSFPLIYVLVDDFICAAAVEEFGKYFVLKKLTWKNPAFNYRFDGVVYSTTVALGFDIIENLVYLFGNDFGNAVLRAAFPGHCILGIYMGYYYGQAKNLELNGDTEGAVKLRRKGLIIAILIHGFYDFCCDIGKLSSSDWVALLVLPLLLVIMSVLNVTAYKNIKKYAHEDKPV